MILLKRGLLADAWIRERGAISASEVRATVHGFTEDRGVIKAIVYWKGVLYATSKYKLLEKSNFDKTLEEL